MNSQFNNNNDLAAKVSTILNEKKSLKAKKIATALGIDRSEVSSFLHANKELFIQEPETFEWSLVNRIELVINFPEVNWLDSETFENTLIKAGSPLDSKAKKITFVVGKKCNILLEATSRLLTLCNQLVMIGKAVTIDFSACKATLHYLDRAGFCDRLDTAVDVLPLRPAISKAETHRGQNTSLMEFGEINPSNLDPKVAEELQKLFIYHAGEQYKTLALTIIAEPLNNVEDHSKSPINGFAAFQKYQGNKKHIQTVVSDSGIGIAGSLRPVLQHKYPKLEKKFSPRTSRSDILLIKEVFEKGGYSQVDSDGRGAGLNRTFTFAVQYNANISIRQENYELRLFYRSGNLRNFSCTENLVKILGTQLCFDFLLD